MKYARIENGLVAEIIHTDPAGLFHPSRVWVECPDNVAEGWSYDGEGFAPPAPVAAPAPTSCTNSQGMLALLQVGKLDAVEAAIEAIADPLEKRKAQIEYQRATWERDNAFLQTMWAQLGGTPEELDALFTLAVTL